MMNCSYNLIDIYGVRYNSFRLVNNNLFYVNKKGEICNWSSGIVKGDCRLSYFFDDFIYLWKNKRKYIYNISSNRLEEHKNRLYPLNEVYFSQKKYCLVYDKEERSNLYELFNQEKGEKIKDDCKISFINNDLFYLITTGFKEIDF